MTHRYLVAEHLFAIDAAPEHFALLTNYAPFLFSDASDRTPLFTIRVNAEPLPSSEGWELVYTDKSDDDMPRIEMYKQPDKWLFLVSMYRDSEVVCAIECSADWREVNLYTDEAYTRFAIDNAAMLVFAFATVSGRPCCFIRR